MSYNTVIDKPDVVLVGAGVMSATLGALLRRLDPTKRIQLFEVADRAAAESSNGWNNAGTGHAGLCELSYTPHAEADGTVDVSNAAKIFEQFEQSRQFWAYCVEHGLLEDPAAFVRPVPHVSFVHGQEQVDFLRARADGMRAHHFFSSIEYSEDREKIAEWSPLLVDGRDPAQPVAATRIPEGTDVNFGAISAGLVEWLSKQEGCGVAMSRKVDGLERTATGWKLRVKNLGDGSTSVTETPYVFVGAGGASLTLLQMSGIDEARGYGGFPVGGQWIVCDKPEIVEKHHAKVYGQAQAEAPTMAVPHLDKRVIDGKEALLFGPFAAWTTKFLHNHGSVTDLPFSVRPDNAVTLVKTGLYNLPLVKYLVKEGLQSKASRVSLLRGFYPEARDEDWEVVDAGIRVQAIKDTAGIVHYGTEVITDADRSISALLGASPGASVSVSVMLDVIRTSMPELLESSAAELARAVPSAVVDITDPANAETFRELSAAASEKLQLTPVMA
ncbi:MAG: malate dehydrogenase (quinone) [Planctomycetota bacterium]